jgi:hypothetical protein
MLRSAPLFAAWCAAKPGSSLLSGVPALRSGMKNAAARPGHGLVIAGLDPAIHLLEKRFLRRLMDTRVKPAYDAS